MLALVLVLLTVALLYAEGRLRGWGKYHRSGSGVPRRAERQPLGRWRGPALGFCALVVLLGVVLPVGVTTYWLLAGLLQGESVRVVWQPLLNSVGVSALAALFTAAAAIPVAVLAVRYPGLLSRSFERVTYSGFALPPIATALALVFFAANYLPWLYQTLGMLVLAYMLRFVPQAVGPLRTSLLQVGPSLEEAARSLGRGPWRATWAVTVPLIRPGLGAGAALVFLTTMKELPSTLLLSPIGFTTLATQTWSATSEAFFSRAAASALLLIAFSSLSMVFVLGAERSIGRNSRRKG
jgi:iron(III) transport system permease protein